MARRKTDRKQKIVNIVAVTLIILLGAYLVIQLSGRAVSSISTMRSQTVTENDVKVFDGYIFRDESLVVADSTVIADFKVSDGEKIKAGTEFAKLYTPSAISEWKFDKYKSELSELNRRISLIRSSIENGKRVADFDKITESLENSYLSYIDSIDESDFTYADAEGQELFGSINDYMVVTGRVSDEEAKSLLASLEAEKAELLGGISNSPISLSSSESGFVYSYTDGYENAFDYSFVDYLLNPELYAEVAEKKVALTPEMLAELTDAEREEYGREVIGKIVNSSRWYMAVPADYASSILFSEGESYTVTFSGCNSMKIDMTLEYNEHDGMMIFSSYAKPEGFDFRRYQRIELTTKTTTGYRIPLESLVEASDGNTTVKCVYVQVGSFVERRRVTLKYYGEGYCIVNTFEEDYAEKNESSIKYLSENEMIIVSGVNLYDGKILK